MDSPIGVSSMIALPLGLLHLGNEQIGSHALPGQYSRQSDRSITAVAEFAHL